jgi:hypothetical protein
MSAPVKHYVRRLNDIGVPYFLRQLPPSTVSTQPPNRETLTCGQHSDVPCSQNHTTVQNSTYSLPLHRHSLPTLPSEEPSSCSTQETLLSHTVVQAEDTPVIVHTALIGGVGQEEEGEEVDARPRTHSPLVSPLPPQPLQENINRRPYLVAIPVLVGDAVLAIRPATRDDVSHWVSSSQRLLHKETSTTVWCHIRGVHNMGDAIREQGPTTPGWTGYVYW